MKIKILNRRYNLFLKREEISFEVDHSQEGGTPPLFEVRKALAKLLKVNLELVYVKGLITRTGAMIATCKANVYDSIEQAKFMEPEHILLRNELGRPKPEPKKEKRK